MDTCKIFTIIILICLETANLIKCENGDMTSVKYIRSKRQTGYMYERPKVSFDLPPRSNPIPKTEEPVQVEKTIPTSVEYIPPNIPTASTQAPTVNIMPTQMYYAYPVPSSGKKENADAPQANQGTTTSAKTASGYNYERQNTGIGPIVNNNEPQQDGYPAKSFSNTGTSVTFSSIGYTYNQNNENGRLGDTAKPGYSNSGSTATASNGGYTYNTGTSQGTIANVATDNTGSVSSGGYNYNSQNTGGSEAKDTMNFVKSDSGPTAPLSGYQVQNTIPNQSGNIADVGYSKSESTAPAVSSGYNYNAQNTGPDLGRNIVNTDTGSTAIVPSNGYNYEAKKTGINEGKTANEVYTRTTEDNNVVVNQASDGGYNYEKQNVVKTQPEIIQLYGVPKPNQENNVKPEVTTSAPLYLPPNKMTQVEQPIETYLPPQNNNAVTKSPQTVNYLPPKMLLFVPEVTVVQKSDIVKSIPSGDYIPPKLPATTPSSKYIPPKVSNSNLSNMHRTGLTRTNGHQYLPPVKSFPSTVAPPASTYLPPVY